MRSPSGMIGKIVVAGGYQSVFWHSHKGVVAAAFAIQFICVIRLLLLNTRLSWWFSDPSRVRAWNLLFNGLVILHGAIWGIFPILVKDRFGFGSFEAAACFLLTSGVAGGSVATLAPRFPLFLAFNALCLTPIAASALLYPKAEGEAVVAIMFITFLVYLSRQGRIFTSQFNHAKHQKQLLETIIAGLPVAITCRDPEHDNSYTLINPAAERLWGLNQKSLGKPPHESLHGEALHLVHHWDQKMLSERGQVQWVETPLETPQGRLFIDATLVRLDDPDLIVEIALDATERRSSREEIHRLQLQQFNNTKLAALGEIAGGVAHEINNPLAIISGNADTMKEALQSPDFDRDLLVKKADKIIATTQRIARITRGLLMSARNAENDPFVATDLALVVRDTLEISTDRLKMREIQLEMNLASDVIAEVRSTQISQCLLNLIGNAIDAVTKLENRWIRVDLEKSGDSAKLSVTDSGPGIRDPKVREKLMQPFFTTKEVGKGTGLGLSITKGILESHGGSFSLNDASPHTQFVMGVPLRRPAKQ